MSVDFGRLVPDRMAYLVFLAGLVLVLAGLTWFDRCALEVGGDGAEGQEA